MDKYKILDLLFDTHKQSFQNLSKTLLAIKDSNRRTIIYWNYKMVNDDKITFERVFQEFGASINEFQYSHPLISIDGTHIYSKYKENLLVTGAYYMKNNVYPYVQILSKKRLK